MIALTRFRIFLFSFLRFRLGARRSENQNVSSNVCRALFNRPVFGGNEKIESERRALFDGGVASIPPLLPVRSYLFLFFFFYLFYYGRSGLLCERKRSDDIVLRSQLLLTRPYSNPGDVRTEKSGDPIDITQRTTL